MVWVEFAGNPAASGWLPSWSPARGCNGQPFIHTSRKMAQIEAKIIRTHNHDCKHVTPHRVFIPDPVKKRVKR